MANKKGQRRKAALITLLAAAIVGVAALVPLVFMQAQDGSLLQSYHTMTNRGKPYPYDPDYSYAFIPYRNTVSHDEITDTQEQQRWRALLEEQVWQLAEQRVLPGIAAEMIQEMTDLLGDYGWMEFYVESFTAQEGWSGELVNTFYVDEERGMPIAELQGTIEPETGKLISLSMTIERQYLELYGNIFYEEVSEGLYQYAGWLGMQDAEWYMEDLWDDGYALEIGYVLPGYGVRLRALLQTPQNNDYTILEYWMEPYEAGGENEPEAGVESTIGW